MSAIALSACTGQGHQCIEYERTIDHGIYGEAVFKQLDKPDTPLYDVVIHLTPFGTAGMAMTRSNEDGLYEFALPAGTGLYQICADFGAAGCTSATVTSLVRADLVVQGYPSGENQIFWEHDNFGECTN